MKKEKQEKVLGLLKNGKYKSVGGDIYSLRTNGEWVKMKGNTLEGGYTQIGLYIDNKHVNVYKHILVYLINNGQYEEGFQIDHLDRNNKNDNPGNLIAKTCRHNIANSNSNGGGAKKIIRGEEIEKIKELLNVGMSQSKIANTMNLNRLSVRYIIKKIESGVPLKYDKCTERKATAKKRYR